MEIILWRPVAARASLMAMPMAPAPPGAKSTRFKSPGASSVNFLARRMAGKLVYRRGQNGRLANCFTMASMTFGLAYPTWWTLLP